ncbi:MAG: MraY family glycosyltransferase [Crocinitomicaceae bacterium]
MITLFAATFIGGLITLPKLIGHFEKLEILDKPNWRSSHIRPTPSSGGISFIITLLVMATFLTHSTELIGVILAALLLAILGFVDDRKGLKPKLKFLFQFVGAEIIYFSGISFNNLNGFLGFEEIDAVPSLILTVLFIIAIINAYNLIDGVDGLAAGISAIASLVFGVIFILKSDYLFATFAFSFLGSLLAFLRFNFNPAKIFMGDVGSLFTGLLMAVFFIRIFSQHNIVHSTVALSVILFPALDMVRLFIVRLLNKKSPFSADNNHYHHLLIKSGDSHKKVAISGYIIVGADMVIGYIVSSYYNLTISLFLTVTLAFLMYVFISIKYYQLAKHKSNQIRKNIIKSRKVNFLLTQFNEK